MFELPSPIIDYLCNHTSKICSPAYFLVEKDGILSNWGGKLTFYGVTNLQKGKSIGEQILFLAGILPLDEANLFLPCIQMENGVSADVHIFSEDEGDWVLLLDATSEENQRRLLQQKGNDLSLLRQKQAKLLHHSFKKQISENLFEKIVSLQVKGERREVTILFANILEFANYSDINPPEVVCKTLNSYLSAMLPPIVSEAGLVDKILTDGVMACFGVLPATDLPPTHATRAALQMIEAVQEVASRQESTTNEPSLKISIGIASGPVVLGIVGSKDWRTFVATGYYVNLAEQLKNQTRSWQVLIDENTFNKLGKIQNHFSFIDLFIQGKTEQIKVYSYLLK
jgi:class 3 adenylate cyclase